jgi:hypothetical protein
LLIGMEWNGALQTNSLGAWRPCSLSTSSLVASFYFGGHEKQAKPHDPFAFALSYLFLRMTDSTFPLNKFENLAISFRSSIRQYRLSCPFPFGCHKSFWPLHQLPYLLTPTMIEGMGTPKRLALQDKLSFRLQLTVCYFLLTGTQTCCWSWTRFLSHPTTTRRLLSISSLIQRNGKNGLTRIIPSSTHSYNQNTQHGQLIKKSSVCCVATTTTIITTGTYQFCSSLFSDTTTSIFSLQVIPPPADVAAGVQNKLV